MSVANPSLEDDDTNLAVVTLVLGITGLLQSFFVIGLIPAAVGLVVGVLHLIRPRERSAGRPRALVGLAFSGLAVFIGVGQLKSGVNVLEMAKRQLRATSPSASGSGSAAAGRWEGVRSPDLTLTTLSGEQFSLRALRGRRVVLNLWATWCGPCQQELPNLAEFASTAPADQVLVIGISNESRSVLEDFARGRDLPFPIVSADGASLPSPYRDVDAIPTTFFIDRNGLIQFIHRGYLESAKLRAWGLAPDFQGEPRSAP